MSVTGIEYNQMRSASTAWGEQADEMEKTSKELAGLSVSGLAPSVQHVASSFMEAWSGYAHESADIASGFADAISTTADHINDADEVSKSWLDRLDGHLGPTR